MKMKQKYKYISTIPKPLLDDFVNNKVIPFVGAGFSKNADIPSGLSMPDWNELGKIVAEEIPDYNYDNNPLDALSYYEMLFSRPKLVELLMRILNMDRIQPGPTYTAFCELFTDTVCTTNFDFLLETAYRNLHKPISIVATQDRLSIAFEGDTKLIKLHGDFNHPERMVVTEYDYDVFLENNPILATYVSNLFITKTMLLIGYSLDDVDLRNLWQVINSRLGKMKRPAYCITVGATKEKIARYERRNIKVINLTGETNDYKVILEQFFKELKEYILEERNKVAVSDKEEINEQLILPAENNYLCFVSCPRMRIAQLKRLVYPVLRECGIIPTRIDDMLMPTDNWSDTSNLLIRKSNMAIVDVSDNNPNVMFELGIILKENKQDSLIIVAERGTEIPFGIQGFQILYYDKHPLLDNEDTDSFYEKLKEMCIKIRGHSGDKSTYGTIQRLYLEGDYTSCVILSYVTIESFLRKRYEKTDKRVPLISLMKRYLIDERKSDIEYDELRQCCVLRNKIVHEGYLPSDKEARQMMKFIQLFKIM